MFVHFCVQLYSFQISIAQNCLKESHLTNILVLVFPFEAVTAIGFNIMAVMRPMVSDHSHSSQAIGHWEDPLNLSATVVVACEEGVLCIGF